ncbi:MAG: PAS domain-containing sensor histidine kinase [Burkholderiaceae bacterium]|jgi:protein-histidine pros-kinase|nr:PAS domain-containing sensor histidine kinase [Burkholderiaceae bacterium]
MDSTTGKFTHNEISFSLIVEYSPNALILADQHGQIAYINRQSQKIFGYALSEIVGKPVEVLIPRRFRKAHLTLRTEYAKAPTLRRLGVGMELMTALRKDGTEFPIEIGINPIHLVDGTWFAVSISDVTARRQAEELRSMKEDMSSSDLLAVAGRSLKNPLVAITGFAEFMLETKKADPAAKQQDVDFLQGIFDASKHIFEVITGLIDSDTIQHQGLTYNHRTVDLSALCAELVRHHEELAGQKDIRLVSHIEPGIVVSGNKARLRTAFENYLNNAIKYSPPDKTVEVRLATIPGPLIEFGVKDEGPGLTEEDKGKVFGRFKKLSAKPTGGEFSSGLGLFIVKTIIGLYNGTVGCESPSGEGAYFWARLPCA